MALDIITFGNAVCDICISKVTPDLFSKHMVRVDTVQCNTGGDALNCAIDCAKLGHKVGSVFKEGGDMFGKFVADYARNETGVDISGMIVDPGIESDVCFILLDGKGSRDFILCSKSSNRLRKEELDFDYLSQAKLVQYSSVGLCGMLDGKPLGELFCALQKAGVKTSMDTKLLRGVSREEFLSKVKDALPYTDYFLPSEEEAAYLSGETQPEKMAAFFKEYGIRNLAIKLGEKGCYITDYQMIDRYIPPIPAEFAIDTIGCGDSFCAGFISSIVWGWGIDEAAMFGNAVGSMNCQVIGSTFGVRSKKETLEYIRKNMECIPEDLQKKFEKYCKEEGE